MIKRMSKATSILVAAAAVVSLIPATGVSAATKTLETKQGTIENAIAFDGGKYIFEGYKTDNDQSGLYFNAGDADKQVNNTNGDSITGDTVEKYGSEYAKVQDGSDEYLVDLANGKVLDNNASDNNSIVSTKLKSTLAKTDRYSGVTGVSLTQVDGSQFGDVWYSYSTTTSGGASFNGYVNDAGKYIDTDDTANMYVTTGTGTAAKTIKVEEFNKANTGSNVVVTISHVTELAQDKDYLYRLVDVNITGGAKSTATYIQKISKAQGTTKDKAYLPNSVTSYEVASSYNSDDAAAANTAIHDTDTSFRVINGTIYAIKNDGSKVTINTIKLKKDKVVATGDTTNTKLDVYLAEKDVKQDQDIAGSDAVSIDVDGNVWALNKGTIYKFDGSNFNAVYTVDRSFNSLDVYNADSLVAWEAGQDAYAVVDNSQATTTPPVTTPVVNKGWVKTDAGWTFYAADGTQTKGQWVNDGGVWYYIKADGIMATGWIQDGGNWYYLNGSGAMKTGWVNDNGTWYFLKSSGAMATGWIQDGSNWYFLNGSGAMLANTTVNGYKLGASGAWIK
ncbi:MULTISPECIES: cell wall-binding protein [unclassified Clostridium]|uniref:N-acetylmuramoyl-L-alanine amidase family protein n=1 Tax=unclassified Clostridium TaxID=2614128 RepID=UPI000297837E|nr:MULTISPECIES: cell wall-binding protein [unclassified Clostridium]EKQ50513.1 MAG: putative cell wall binding protein [Clostridium sp. Maddingley MBC34-26]